MVTGNAGRPAIPGNKRSGKTTCSEPGRAERSRPAKAFQLLTGSFILSMISIEAEG